METLLQWLTLHADNAHFIIFGLLLLAGFSLPISEEFMLIAGGVLASNVIPDNCLELFLAVYLGCYFSDCIAYWLGRYFGKKLYSVKWLSFCFKESRVKKLNLFYERYGFLTLVVGRFIPFGVRNGIFMTAGIGKMHFGKFALIDAIGCFFFSLLIFSLAYSFGRNYENFSQMLNQGNWVLFTTFIVVSFGILGVQLYKNRKVKAPLSKEIS